MGCDKKWGGRQILISDPNREIPIVEWFEGERESDTEVREAFNGGRGGLLCRGCQIVMWLQFRRGGRRRFAPRLGAVRRLLDPNEDGMGQWILRKAHNQHNFKVI